MKKVVLSLGLAAIAGLIAHNTFLSASSVAIADDSLGTKVKNDVEDAKTNLKKDSRAVKRKGRHAKKDFRNKTNHGSLREDAKDTGKDVGDKIDDIKDDASAEKNKLKN